MIMIFTFHFLQCLIFYSEHILLTKVNKIRIKTTTTLGRGETHLKDLNYLLVGEGMGSANTSDKKNVFGDPGSIRTRLFGTASCSRQLEAYGPGATPTVGIWAPPHSPRT